MIDGWRVGANLATLANGLLGVGAVLYALAGNPIWALLLIAIAVGFDGLDGLLSRRSRRPAARFGRFADSISDAVTFGVAPAVVIAAHPGQGAPWPAYEPYALLVAGLVLALAVARLTYFTLYAHDRPDFLGVPTPQNALAIALYAVWFYRPAFLGLSPALFLAASALTAVAMVVPLRFPKVRGRAAVRSVMALGAIASALVLVPIQFVPAAGTPLYELAFSSTLVWAASIFTYYAVGPFTVNHGPPSSPG